MSDKEFFTDFYAMGNLNDLPDYKYKYSFSYKDEYYVIDFDLMRDMRLTRKICALGHSVRASMDIKTRQPLSKITIIYDGPKAFLCHPEFQEMILDELNIKTLDFIEDDKIDEYITVSLKPNFKQIGIKHKALVPEIKKALAEASDELKNSIKGGDFELPLKSGVSVFLDESDIQVDMKAKPREGCLSASEGGLVVMIDSAITPELRAEWIARELVSFVNSLRGELKLNYSDRITMELKSSDEFLSIFEKFGNLIKKETLSVYGSVEGIEPVEVVIDGVSVFVKIKVI